MITSNESNDVLSGLGTQQMNDDIVSIAIKKYRGIVNRFSTFYFCGLWLLMVVSLGCNSCHKNRGGEQATVTGPPDRFVKVTLTHPNQKPVTVRAELAITPKERDLGMMFRGELAPKNGMLFVFEKPQILSFWMKNTAIPLDMIFISEHKKVLGVVHNARPHSLEGRGVGNVPSLYVLEVNSGFSKRHGIEKGAKVDFTLPDSARRTIRRLRRELEARNQRPLTN